MAIIVEPMKIAVNVLLNNGLTPSGSIKTLSMKLGNIDYTRFDASKAWALVEPLRAVLAKSIYALVKVDTGMIMPED